jgi:Polyketide cyclase / dehydrase and lipid transport
MKSIPSLLLPTMASDAARLLVNSAQRSVECNITIDCDPATLFAVWADVSQWHTWDPDTKWACLNGPIQVGSQGRLAPQKGLPVNMSITQTQQNHSFTAAVKVFGSQMVFRHQLQIQGDGLLVVHHVQFKGWISPLLMKTVGNNVAKGLPLTMTRLKALCESL